MNYRDPTLRDKLAAEYVLGLLRGAARRRFERLLVQEVALREAVVRWEQHLDPLTERIAPIAPPKRVWRAIALRIGGARPSLWQRLDFWRPFAIAASTAVAMLLVYVVYVTVPPEVVAPARVAAVLQDKNAQPAWIVHASGPHAPIEVQPLAPQTLATNQSFELWLIPAESKTPISLGLLPVTGRTALIVPERLQPALAHGAVLAVSLEPEGGSPTGQPTGPVLYQGNWLAQG